MTKNKQEAKSDILLQVPVTFKIVESKEAGDQKGVIEAYVSIFGNVDLVGDVIEKGAFAESLKKKLPKGVWAHNWDEPIALTLEAREDNKGLFIRGQFIEGVQKADEAYKLIKAGVIDEFSIGFRVLDDEWREDGVRVIKKAKLYEWSPVLAGANPDTELVSIKADKKCDDHGEGADNATEPVKPEETPAEGEEKKGIIEDEMQIDWADRERKWTMVDKMDNIIYKFFDIYFRNTTKASDFKTLILEVNDLLIKLADQFDELTANIKSENDKAEIKTEVKSMLERISNQINGVAIDSVKSDIEKGTIELFFTQNGEKKSTTFKVSDKFKNYQRGQQALKIKVEAGEGEGDNPQKILRIKQIAKQNLKANQYLLRIIKN